MVEHEATQIEGKCKGDKPSLQAILIGFHRSEETDLTQGGACEGGDAYLGGGVYILEENYGEKGPENSPEKLLEERQLWSALDDQASVRVQDEEDSEEVAEEECEDIEADNGLSGDEEDLAPEYPVFLKNVVFRTMVKKGINAWCLP